MWTLHDFGYRFEMRELVGIVRAYPYPGTLDEVVEIAQEQEIPGLVEGLVGLLGQVPNADLMGLDRRLLATLEELTGQAKTAEEWRREVGGAE